MLRLLFVLSRNGNLFHLNSENPRGNEIITIRETDSVAVFTGVITSRPRDTAHMAAAICCCENIRLAACTLPQRIPRAPGRRPCWAKFSKHSPCDGLNSVPRVSSQCWGSEREGSWLK